MNIEPKYKNWETAPLEFYKFLKWAVWLGFAWNIINAVTLLSNFTTPFLLIDIAILIVAAILGFKAGIGLRNREWAGVKALYALTILNTVYGAIGFALTLNIEDIVYPIGYLIIFILTKIYFDKRRLLFYPYASEYESYEGTGYDIEMPIPVQQVNTIKMETSSIRETQPKKAYCEEEPAAVSDADSLKTSVTDDPIFSKKEDNGGYWKHISSEEKQQYDDVDAETSDDIMFCYKCGHKISADALFCEKCGAKLR